jgi:signal transduction histidine kinase
MSSARNPFGLRLALWYAAVFTVSALTIVLLTYALTARSLAARDHQILQSKVGEYAAAYGRGGFRALTSIVQSEQAVAPERLFVRVLDRGVETVWLSNPEGWDPSRIEFESARLGDGTIVQVGKSNEPRYDLLARLRVTLLMLTALILVIALVGGWVATESAMSPIRSLTATVRQIVDTGAIKSRVPLTQPRGQEDAIDQLGVLFNAMLDRIERLVEGMRGSLDNVSHDLRTPLARLRGRAEQALSRPPDLAQYRAALEECVEDTDHTLVMLTTLMDISEAESGTMALQRQPVDLHDVVERAVDLYRDVAESKGVALTIVPSTGAAAGPLMVDADRPRLEQVSANLIDNAIKFTAEDGRVDVRLSSDDGTVRLEVRDTGRGIPAHELPRIWDRLFRGDLSRTERGLGLGLSLVRAIVEAHGGTVSAESTFGDGSTFTVLLPVAGTRA